MIYLVRVTKLQIECVAEYTNRPLLSITPGDLGTSAYGVEQALNKFFELGERWGAILLLDEADIFLESRTESDLERNSLVSGERNFDNSFRER